MNFFFAFLRCKCLPVEAKVDAQNCGKSTKSSKNPHKTQGKFCPTVPQKWPPPVSEFSIQERGISEKRELQHPGAIQGLKTAGKIEGSTAWGFGVGV